MIKSGITQEEIIGWAGKDIFNQGLMLANSHGVGEVEYDDEKLEIRGKIRRADGWMMPVALKLEPGRRVKSLCPCATNQRYGQICEHVVAIGIAQMVNEMDAPEPRRSAAGTPPPTEAAPEPDFIEVPAQPKFYAYVRGSRASLAIEIDVYYTDEISFPVGSVQAARTVYLPDDDDPLVRRVRNPKAEDAALDTLKRYGFEAGYRSGDLKFYLTSPQKLLTFLGAGLPDLRRRGWTVELHPDLDTLVNSFCTVAPLVEIRDAPDGQFDIGYSFEAFSERGRIGVSPAEIQAAVNRGDGCLLRDGAPILLDYRAIEAMHAVFRDVAPTQGGAPPGFFRVKPVHAPYVKSSLDALGIDYADEAARHWREEAMARNRERGESRFEPVALGPLDAVLRPYQKQGVYWMRFLEQAGVNGLLADEMGLGKTLQTLAWLSLPRVLSATPRAPALIVCPTSLVRNWESEAHRFVPQLKTLVLSGPDRARDFKRIPEADLVITSYALLQRDFEDAYLARDFSVAVLDEAQHIKNRRTRNAKSAKGLHARCRLVLTGTPVENSVSDVWSIFDFLMPDYLGDYESFKVAYEQPIDEGGENAAEVQSRLKRKLHPFILRRLKTTVAKDLPDKLVKVSYCPIPEETQRDYNAVLQKERRGAKTKFQMLALLMKLRRIASRGKVDAFLEQLDEAIDGGHRVLVFSQFVTQLKVLGERLRDEGIPFCYLDGATKDRLGACNRFNHDPSIPVFLISLMAGGTGLNLTGADMVMHYDPWWNPAVEDQATDRAHRIGQKKKVYVVKLIAADTIEEKVLALQRRKQAVIAATVSTSDEAIVERLSTQDLAELLS